MDFDIKYLHFKRYSDAIKFIVKGSVIISSIIYLN